MKRKVLYRIFTVLASISIFIIVGFIAIMVPANSKAFYRWQFEKHNTLDWVQSQAEELYDESSADYDPNAGDYVSKMTDQQLENLMMHVMRYCMWLEDDLNITVEGQYLKIFRADERSHMQDVKNLFGGGIILTIVALLICITFLFFLLNRPKEYYETSRKIPFFTFGVLLTLIVLVAIFALTNFAYTFEIFHQIFFTGNYAFANGVMVSMITEIFPDLATLIAVGWLVLLIIPAVVLVLYNRHVAKKLALTTENRVENDVEG